MATLQPITPAIASLFKAIRLRALLDTPSAFGAMYAKEILLTDSDWKSRAAQWNGERSVAYLAMDGDDPCGIVAGFLEDTDATTANLVSMWVAPTHRKSGVGKLLVEAIIDWTRRKSATAVSLMVTHTNFPAMAFYRRVGFTFTGQTKPYANDPSLVVREMQRCVSDLNITLSGAPQNAREGQNDILILPATVEHAPEIARVNVDAWRSTYRGIIAAAYLDELSYVKQEERNRRYLAEPGVHLVAESPTAGIVGYIRGGRCRGDFPQYQVEIYAIYILQEFQNRGIGRELFRQWCITQRQLGLNSALVWVLEHNKTAIEFYQRMGAKFVQKQSIEIGGQTLSEMALGWQDLSFR